MEISLKGHTALVTGSTGGIGFATATALAGAGAAVIVNGRDAARVDAALTRLQAAVPGAEARGAVADVGTAEGCAALVDAEPTVDILVNNAGIFGPRDFFETPDSDWQQFLDTNVLSGVRLARAYAPAMVARGWGRVLFISSESALNIPADMIHYGVTKTANLSVSRGLAKRLAGTGVTVNAILPGPTLSEGVQAMLGGDDAGEDIAAVAADFVRRERPSSIIGRAATVEEVANMIVYAASEQASATTGAALRVDGGVVDTIA